MVGSTDVVRIKCGQIYILSDDNFSLICEFCDNEFLTLFELRDHLLEHFPKIPKTSKSIKKEPSLSSESDCEITSWDLTGVKEELLADVQRDDTGLIFIKIEDKPYAEESGPFLGEMTQYCETTMNSEKSKELDDQSEPNEIVDKPNGKFPADLQSSSNPEEGTSSPKENDEANPNDIYSERLRRRNQTNFLLMIHPNYDDGTDSDGTTDYTEPKKNDSDLQTKLPFECSFCSETFKHDRNRNYHENTHTGKLPQCRECSKTFSTLDKLTHHLKKHKKVLQCKVCSEIFNSKHALDMHRRMKHMPKKVRRGKHIPCMLCNIKFTTQHHLDLHMAAHKRKSERANVIYTCDYCRKQFKKKESIVSHMKMHSGIKPFKCSNCGYAFARFCNAHKHEMSCYARSANKEKSK